MSGSNANARSWLVLYGVVRRWRAYSCILSLQWLVAFAGSASPHGAHVPASWSGDLAFRVGALASSPTTGGLDFSLHRISFQSQHFVPLLFCKQHRQVSGELLRTSFWTTWVWLPPATTAVRTMKGQTSHTQHGSTASYAHACVHPRFSCTHTTFWVTVLHFAFYRMCCLGCLHRFLLCDLDVAVE